VKGSVAPGVSQATLDAEVAALEAMLGKQIRQVVIQAQDASGNETITATALTETSLKASITPTAADSRLLIFCTAQGSVSTTGTNAEREAVWGLHKDTTAGEGSAANGTLLASGRGGRSLTGTSATAARSQLSASLIATDLPGDTNAHTYTFVVGCNAANLSMTFFNDLATRGRIIILELEP
jgi:hypothetical protein